MAFADLQEWRLHQPTGQLMPVLSQPHSKKVFPDVQKELPVLQLVPTDSGPVTGHHEEEPGATLFALSLHVFT